MPRIDPATALAWESSEEVADAKRKVKDMIDQGQAPKSTDFASAWSTLKGDIMRNQAELCAWCTCEPGAGGSAGAVDHIRPKSEVIRFTMMPNGERKASSPKLKPAYWWLAYSASNLVLSCDRCNRSKGSYWPVEDPNPDGPASPPMESTAEMELALDPYAPDFNPFDHFEALPEGVLRGKSKKARFTIAMCALTAPTVTQLRQKQATRELKVPDTLRALRSAPGTDPEADADATRNLERMATACAWRSPFAWYTRAALGSALARLAPADRALFEAAWTQRQLQPDLSTLPTFRGP